MSEIGMLERVREAIRFAIAEERDPGIAALRELETPTEKMVAVGAREYGSPQAGFDHGAFQIFRAMIRAELGE